MSRYAILNSIERLDPEKDHQRIIFLSTCYDFPFDTTRALEFALFRTFCVPSISALLDRTGEFSQRSQKRYDDTDIIVSELLEWGYDSERGKRALRRLNQLHGRFTIANEDFLYVLSTFIFEPIRWNEQFGWRLLCAQERLGHFYFWREVGRRMNIRGIPRTTTFSNASIRTMRESIIVSRKPIGEWVRQPVNCLLVGFHIFWRRWCGQRSMPCWTIGLLRLSAFRSRRD
jgi:hypothetical protein